VLWWNFSLDLYIPVPGSKGNQAAEEGLRAAAEGGQVGRHGDAPGEALKPVLLFVHGGVWASGDKWQVQGCTVLYGDWMFFFCFKVRRKKLCLP